MFQLPHTTWAAGVGVVAGGCGCLGGVWEESVSSPRVSVLFVTK